VSGGRGKILKIAFLVSYAFLILWAFSPVRSYLQWKIPALFVSLRYGFTQRQNAPAQTPEISVLDFDPHSELVPVSEHLLLHPKFPVIEFHGHLFGGPFNGPPADIAQQMARGGYSYFVDLALLTSTLPEYKKLVSETKSDHVFHFVSFNWRRSRASDDFGPAMARDLEEIAKAGAIGIKLWKNLGLTEKDHSGKLIALDDARLDPVWDVCAKYRLTIAMHTADPPAFFHPIDAHNERIVELGRRPEWSFSAAEFPKFDEVMAGRDRLFTRRKDLRFVALHFGEFANDLKKAADMLDRHPNVSVDMAARIDELGRQPVATRNFFIKYQDRILYGTDGLPDFEKIRIYWRFLETSDEHFDYYPANGKPKGLWKIYGLNLPDTVLRKIYFQNAAKLLRI